ncbi:MAG: magnesium/cobalt transporter CorA [Promethearchaeota archaeon]
MMQEPGKRRIDKVGLPPGTLLYVGDKPVESTVISYTIYDEKNVSGKVVSSIEELPEVPSAESVLWIQITGLGNIEQIQHMGEKFHLDSLVLEDVLATDQRPKHENYDGYEYTVIQALTKKVSKKTPDQEQISLILGSNYVISIQERQTLLFQSIREWIQHNHGQIRTRGPYYLLYSLIDSIVDQYFVFLEAFGEEIEDLEEELVSDPTQITLQTIYDMKRTMAMMRKVVWPLREVISRLERTEAPVLRDRTGRFLGDIYDHVIRVLESVETSRETLSGMLDIYLTSMSNRMNEVMKVLTIVATIFIPLTLIVGIYGMNFPNMPEYHFPYSYPILLIVMLCIGVGLLAYFRKKRWL